MIPGKDIRQSEKWALFLQSLGWKSNKTTSGIIVATRDLKIGSVAKLQRPRTLSQQDLDEIENICKAQKALFLKIEPMSFDFIPLLEKNKFVQNDNPLVPTSTFYIDLTKSEEELWDNVSRSAKYSINRSKREGTKIRFYQNPIKEKLAPYYSMCQETGRAKKFFVEPYKNLLAKVKAFGKESHLVLAYDKDGELLSGKFYLCFNDMVLYTTGGTTSIGRNTKAGYQLLWDSILYFKGFGYKVLDLEGKSDERFAQMYKNWEGFSHFKEKFGPMPVDFPPPYNKYFNPMLKIIQKFFKMPL